ncbi:MAG TPA: oligopeptidase B, partial [Dermatophilaceae bacterium]|nr:oligopeptidase B [Dermatophilaceae bacterium]
MQPPRAPREPQSRIVHGHAVLDDYAWMADRDDPRLRAYLEAENAYAAERTGHLDPLVERIVGELKSRTVETDLSVAVRHGGWWYYGRTIEGAEYPVHARVAISDSPDRPVLDGQTPPAHEQVLLDENVEAGDADFFAVGASEMSPDGRLLAWSADREGDERYDLVVREVDSGAILDATVRGIGDPLAWSLDNRHIFYTRLDESWRSHEIWRHEVGTAVEADELVLAESDERFFLSVGATADDRWVVLSATSKTAAQVWLIDAADPRQAPRSVLPRRDEVIYDVDPLADGLLVLHNAGRANFQVDWLPCAGAPVEDLVDLGWTTPDEFVTGMDAFATFVVLSLRVDGLTALRFVPV